MLMKSTRSKTSSLILALCLCAAIVQSAVATELYSVRRLSPSQGASAVAHSINSAGQVAGGSGVPHAPSGVGVIWSGRGLRDIQGPARGDYTSALGINDNQRVVGSTNTDTAVRAFEWTAQSGLRFLPLLPGDNSSEALAINNAGTIAGFSGGASGLRAVLWTSTGIRNLGILPGGDHSEAVALNSGGDAVGFSNSSAGSRAILWTSSGAMRDLGTLPGDSSSAASAMNDARQVVGSSAGDAGSRAVLWTESGGIQNLGTLPGGDHSQAAGINNSGQVVGTSDSSLGLRAFIWTDQAGMVDLNTLIPQNSNVILSSAVAINQAGQIVAIGGVGHDLANDRLTVFDDEVHGGPSYVFLLTPVR
jgi:probable HAF family extracellular repeat protein